MALNSLWVVILDPLFSKQFRWLEPKSSMSDYLDWRENISSGPKVSRQYTIVEFAMEYLERYFTKLDQVICFPPSIHGSLAFNEEKIDAKYVSQLFTELFRKKLTKGIRAVLADYDVYEHANSLNYELEGYITPFSDNRVVIFYSELNLIFIVRVASSSDCINQESQNCSTDVKYFLCVNKPLIEKKALTVVGVLACPSVERKDLKDTLAFQFSSNFELFDVLLICKDELQSYEHLNEWWCYRFFKFCSLKKCYAVYETLFKQLIGLTMLVIAKDDDSLPTLESSTQKQIESMICEQIIALGVNNLKKVITGGFGSGKSVFGKEIVKSFYMKASKPAILYYICCDHFSLLECEMKRFANYLQKDSNSNVKIICNNLFELWRSMCEKQRRSEQVNISLPELLQYYGEKSSTTVNFVLNELSGEYIKEEDENQLKKLFSSRLKESLVVFIIQSTEKNRSIEQILRSNNNLSEEKLGMKSINFENSERVIGSIQLVKPKLVFLPKISLVEESSAKILSVVLENLCFEKVRSTVVICSDMQELKLVAYAIDNIVNYRAVVYSPHLQKNSPNLNEKEKVTELIKITKLNVLVTDSRAMCGLESEAVIIFVKPEEYYLRHVIVDVCARSNSYLTLLVLPSESRSTPSVETVNKVLKNWSEKDIAHQIRIKVVSNGNKDPLCTLTEGNLVINDQCNKFKTRRTMLNFPDYVNKHFKTNSKNILT